MISYDSHSLVVTTSFFFYCCSSFVFHFSGGFEEFFFILTVLQFHSDVPHATLTYDTFVFFLLCIY